MYFEKRLEIFKALVGSYNYNLNSEKSDKDYRVFISPNFEDLYNNKFLSKSYIGIYEDYHVQDIRKLSTHFYKGNINFLEVLFSEEIIIKEHIKSNKTLYENLMEIFNEKENIASMNLSSLYNSCIGMHKNKINNINKGTEGTIELVKKYGYDTKQALHSYRLLDFLERYYYTEFKNFKRALYYEDESKEKLLSIKFGGFSLEEFKIIAEEKLNKVLKLEKYYKSYKEDDKLKEKLDNIIKNIVKMDIYLELH